MKEIQAYIDKPNAAISIYFDEQQSDLHCLAKEAVVNGGKRIRGLLCLLSCEAVSGSYSDAIAIAVGYEFYHAAALLQDDIIDCADYRRGELSAYKKYGVNITLLTSDFLLFELNQILAKSTKSIDNERLSLILAAFGKYAQLATLGEYLDIKLGNGESLELSDYIEMVTYKTGALLSAAAVTGAIIGHATPEEIEILTTYTDNHGIAYQIYDDILDITGTPEKIGKPTFNDLVGGKKNILILHLLSELATRKDERKSFIEGLINKKHISNEDKAQVLSLLNELNSIQYANNLANHYHNLGLEALARLKVSNAKDQLIKLSSYLSTRYQ